MLTLAPTETDTVHQGEARGEGGEGTVRAAGGKDAQEAAGEVEAQREAQQASQLMIRMARKRYTSSLRHTIPPLHTTYCRRQELRMPAWHVSLGRLPSVGVRYCSRLGGREGQRQSQGGSAIGLCKKHDSTLTRIFWATRAARRTRERHKTGVPTSRLGQPCRTGLISADNILDFSLLLAGADVETTV